MSRPTLDQLMNSGDYATTIHWSLSFSQLPAGLRGVIESDYINLRCESVDMPKASNSKIKITIRGHSVYQPGLTEPSGSISLTLYDTVDSKISEFIRLWREICYETGTGYQTKRSDASATVLLNRMDRQDHIIWSYELRGVFLEDYDPGGQLQGSSAEALKPTITLSYDKFTDAVLR